MFRSASQTRDLAEASMAAAKLAQATIDRHMAECGIRHAEIKLSLERQDGVLDKIQTIIGRSSWGVLTILVSLIGGLLVFISNAIHVHIGG